MKKRSQTAQQRALRIEMLRARAAVERQSVARGVETVAQGLRPGALLQELLPAGLARRGPGDWLMHALGLAGRYPYLLSAASALYSGTRRRNRWLRLGIGLLVSWQLARSRRTGAAESRS